MMKSVLLAVLAFAAVAAATELPTSYFLLDEVPGIDFVGFGYDTRYEEPRNALTVPLIDYAYTKGKSYIYPTDPNRKMRVPDELFVRTVAYTEADSYYYTSIEEMKKLESIKLGMEVSTETTTNDTEATCVYTEDPETKEIKKQCTTTAYSSNSNLFSVGSKSSQLKESLSQKEQYIIEQSEKTQLYHVYLDTEALRVPLLSTINHLTNDVPVEQVDPFIRFLETYGTHYIAGAIMGGQVKATSNVQQELTTSSDTDGTQTSTKFVTAQEAMRTAKKTFSQQTAGVTTSFDKATVDSNLERTVSSSWLLLGGDSNVVDLLDYRNSSDAIRVWKKTIVANPVPVAYRLREISTLFVDADARLKMHMAVDIFMKTNATAFIKNVQLSDTFFKRDKPLNLNTQGRPGIAPETMIK